MFTIEDLEVVAIMVASLIIWFLVIHYKEKIVKLYENKIIRAMLRLNFVLAITVFSISQAYDVTPFLKGLALLYFISVQPTMISIEATYQNKHEKKLAGI